MSEHKFKMFTQDGCSYCELAKIVLMEQDHDFEVINIKDNAQALAVLRLRILEQFHKSGMGICTSVDMKI